MINGATGSGRAAPAPQWAGGQTRSGRGAVHGHHGELLQGVFTGADGRLQRGLTTLPCSLFSSEAIVELDTRSAVLSVEPAWKAKARDAASATAAAVGWPRIGGRLVIRSNTEVGRGFGSSTSDVTAAIRAVLDALGVTVKADRIARLAVQSEVAADPLMFDGMLLFAHREGQVIESFGPAVPPFRLLGFPLGIDRVDTVAFPPAVYNRSEVRDFETLRTRLRHAAARSDLAEIGLVATESARINQRFLPVPAFGALLDIADRVGAAGLQVAHSGNVGGFLFDPAGPEPDDRIAEAAALLRAAGTDGTWHYASGPSAPRT
ncbi:GHMP kinase [Kitasatospora sp. NPDC036755]|uniref:GHMP family kinase ATP-binding protein n=1 Tax=Kitasatospora sp. NPDC036755 TaxID=3154600 RepID=UPI0033E5CA8B